MNDDWQLNKLQVWGWHGNGGDHRKYSKPGTAKSGTSRLWTAQSSRKRGIWEGNSSFVVIPGSGDNCAIKEGS